MEDWAQIRRLHRAEGVPIREVARRLGVSRNTVRAALASDRPPQYQRPPHGSVADAYESQIRALLVEWPKMPAPVIAERIRWPHSMSPLKKKLQRIRPEYVGIDPVDRFVYRPGEIAQCDLWFPEPRICVGEGQHRMLPVLVMVLGFSRMINAVMLPSRQGGDILSGMWSLICGWGRVPKTLVWDREAAIGGTGRVSAAAAAFAGTMATRIQLAPPRDPEYKGLVERMNGYLETSFLPGRHFASPSDFNDRLSKWLIKANTRAVRVIGARPVDLFETDTQAMLALPPISPSVGLAYRVRLSRDYYVRVDAVDYSVDPRVIGRFVDITASPQEVTARCEGQVVARHQRCWASHAVITDPSHVATAAGLRTALTDQRASRVAASRRHHGDGHPVALRALPDYDALWCRIRFHPNNVRTRS